MLERKLSLEALPLLRFLLAVDGVNLGNKVLHLALLLVLATRPRPPRRIRDQSTFNLLVTMVKANLPLLSTCRFKPLKFHVARNQRNPPVAIIIFVHPLQRLDHTLILLVFNL